MCMKSTAAMATQSKIVPIVESHLSPSINVEGTPGVLAGPSLSHLEDVLAGSPGSLC